MRGFSIAGLQLTLSAGDNCDTVENEIRGAKARFPFLDMIMAPELALFGPSPKNAVSLPCETELRFCRLARDLGVWVLPGTLFESVGGQIFNTAPVINPDGEVVLRYRKIFPFEPYEVGITPGNTFGLFDVPGVGRFGLSICYDMWFAETTRTLAWAGAEILLHPSMTNTIDRDAELAIARSSAVTNQLYVFDLNIAGKLGFGRSGVYGPGGEIIHEAGSGHEVVTVEIDLDYVTRVRERGWNGLGQPLKSFRDSSIVFPPYQKGSARSEYLKSLGPLKIPENIKTKTS